jgi:heterodisulfide reductase subunit A
MMTNPRNPSVIGAVAVIGGGIGGIQCALDLADSGFFVHLIDTAPTLGGIMARLDKTFPTNDCATCMFSPKMVQVAGHDNIRIHTMTTVQGLSGAPGQFSLTLEQAPRYIDAEKCIACGQCAARCPQKVPDAFNADLSQRRAAYLTFPQAVPLIYAIDPRHCLYLNKGRCGLCAKICPAKAVDFDQKPTTTTLEVGAVVVAGGFEPVLTRQHSEYGYGRYRNVVSSLDYERILSATGPFAGHMHRPSDGKPPASVAWIQCVLSRDASKGRPFCSSVCCMHANKQAVMTRTHLPETRTVIYFMDIRAMGKGFDDYIDRARNQHGVKHRRSMISQIYLNPRTEGLIVETFNNRLGRKIEEEFDMIVLSCGFQPSASVAHLVQTLGLKTNPYGFVQTGARRPLEAGRPGVFVCGAAEAPKDIPDTVVQAGAAASQAAALIQAGRFTLTPTAAVVTEAPLAPEPRIGVFVCHCGTNIAATVDIPAVVKAAADMPQVALATDFTFTCATDTQTKLIEAIHTHRLNRVVVAACSPRTHEPLFRETLRQAGLNPYLFEMASIREHCAWIHAKQPQEATTKAVSLIRAAVARAARLEPLHDHTYTVEPAAVVVGGGVAGMSAALALADQGFEVYLVEKSPHLGGFARHLTQTLEGESAASIIGELSGRVTTHARIHAHLESRLARHNGHVGAFDGMISGPEGDKAIRYGAVVVATGAKAYEPREFGYGGDPRVITQVELARRLHDAPEGAKKLSTVVMIQCVGSRNADFGACSRVCCSAAVANALRIKALNPAARVIILYRDMRTFGFKELYYLKARQQGVLFFRYIPEQPPSVVVENGRLVVDFHDRGAREDLRVHPTMVVLAAGIRPSEDAAELAGMLKLSRTREGFFMEAHAKLRPVDTAVPGVFLAGLAHSPRFMDEAMAMAMAASQQAAKILCRRTMSHPATVAEVNPKICTACLVCVRMCPFGAPFINRQGVSEIPPSDCRGCGICVAECPARAITLRHATDDQLEAKIDAILEMA